MKKRTISVLCAAALAVSLTACGASGAKESGKAESESNSEAVEATETENTTESGSEAGSTSANNQIANPWTDCQSLAEAAQIAGFEYGFPETLVDGTYTVTNISAMEGDIDVTYSDNSSELQIRQAKQTTEDITGDYNSYSETNTAEYNGVSYTTRGDNGTISVTTFDYEDMSYVIYTYATITIEKLIPIIAEKTGTEEVAMKVDSEQIDLLDIAGGYQYSDQMYVSLNMYSSWEDGSNEVGNCSVTNATGKEIISYELVYQTGTNTYTVGSEGTFTFTIYKENGTICMDWLTEDGAHIYLTMETHYQS